MPCPTPWPPTQHNPTQFLSFFTFSLNCIWPCSAESWLLQGRTPYCVTAVSLALEKLQLRSGQSDREAGAVLVHAPWVLRMRHIETFRVPIQLCLPCSQCSGHIYMYFSTFIPIPFLLKSVLLKSVGYCSDRTSTWIQYGSPFYVLYSRWKVKEKKWQIPRAISIFMCTMRFLSYFLCTFVSCSISVTQSISCKETSVTETE
jgi:hypothetical protein